MTSRRCAAAGGGGAFCGGCKQAGDRARTYSSLWTCTICPAAEPGQFYLRELPPLRAVLDGLDGMNLLIVDGYADLDPGGRPSLGAHAHAEFGVPVIGVAKTAFRTATHAVPVVRGEGSTRPLYVTAAGMSRHQAAELIRHMAGRYRLPDALRRADAIARGIARGRPRRS
jgi:deoxyribonuclease V